MKQFIISNILVFLASVSFSQTNSKTCIESDKCGAIPITNNNSFLKAGFGYDFSDLQDDIAIWESQDYVWIQSIGTSVQNRNLYLITITDSSTSQKEFRITIHARTHPNEVQSTYVTNEIIKLLLSNTVEMSELREKCIFTIIPMINPDGVELEYNRENANMVNLESNWNAASPEIEVAAVMHTYDSLMNSSLPITIALNMHSTYDCERYFVFHDKTGSSLQYEEMQKRFIALVQQEPSSDIASWDRFVSWKTSTPTQYPESWFWLNHHENVLALTYEDMNCSQAGDYDISAKAIVHGIGKYLNILSPISTINQNNSKQPFAIVQENKVLIITNDEPFTASVLSIQGSVIQESNKSTISISVPGVYILTIKTKSDIIQQKVVIQ